MTNHVSRRRGDRERAEPARGRALAAALALATALIAWPQSPVEGLVSEPVPATKTTKKARTKGRGQAPAPVAVAPKPAPPEPTPAEVAIEAAREQLGKPYRWAGVGPNSFDCSGLVMFAYRQAGIELPHNSRAQLGHVQRVPVTELRPGDLVFSRGHVGLYIGDGRMIHSPHSGRHVEVAPLRSNLIGAGRPVV